MAEADIGSRRNWYLLTALALLTLALLSGALLLGGGNDDSAPANEGATGPTSEPSVAPTSAATDTPTVPSPEATDEPLEQLQLSEAVLALFEGHDTRPASGATYGASGSIESAARPEWATDLEVRAIRGENGLIYVDVFGPASRVLSLCGEVDLLEGTQHLPEGVDYCSSESGGQPYYFEDLQSFDPRGIDTSEAHLIICTGIETLRDDLDLAVWAMTVLEGGRFEAAEWTIGVSEIDADGVERMSEFFGSEGGYQARVIPVP